MTSEATETANLRRPTWLRSLLIWIAVGAVVVVLGAWAHRMLDREVRDYDVVLTPHVLPADGVTSAQLTIRLISRFGNDLDATLLPRPPAVELVSGGDLVRVVRLDALHYRLIPGFRTGEVVIHVTIAGAIAPIEATLQLTPSLADRNHNGYPDALDLSSASDRDRFRRWFTAIAVGQLRHLDDRWHDRDCAGLLRYCYREALRRHDNQWLASRQWLEGAVIPDVAKYNYPDVPLVGPRVFNAGARMSDAAAHPASNRSLDEFRAFAEAARLKDNSLEFISRSVHDALPGDVIFYLNDGDAEWPYHSMIYLGGGETIYHTGPDGHRPGIVKHVSLRDLALHPNPRWHPVADNPYFLGFYRWRILSDD